MNSAELWQDPTFKILFDDLVKAKKNETLAPIRLQALINYVAPTLAHGPAVSIEAVQGPLPVRRAVPKAAIPDSLPPVGTPRCTWSCAQGHNWEGDDDIEGFDQDCPECGEAVAFTTGIRCLEEEAELGAGHVLEDEEPGKRTSLTQEEYDAIKKKGNNLKTPIENTKTLLKNLDLQLTQRYRRDPNEGVRKSAQIVFDRMKAGQTTIYLPRKAQVMGQGLDLEKALKELKAPFTKLAMSLVPPGAVITAGSTDNGDDSKPVPGFEPGGWAITVM